jgi:hypothetical protein
MKLEVRVVIYTQDRELRAWLVDELALISPTIEARTVDALDASAAQLLIVGIDTLTLAEIDRLRALTIPIIAIGAATRQLASLPFACVLDARLTSKQLKYAVRDTLATPLVPVSSLPPV